MRKLLLDENMTAGLRELPPNHEVQTVRTMGWLGTKNGRLLAAAAEAGFEALITVDKNVAFQQNLEGKPALIVLDIHPTSPANQIACLSKIAELLPDLRPGKLYRVEGPHPKRDRRS